MRASRTSTPILAMLVLVALFASVLLAGVNMFMRISTAFILILFCASAISGVFPYNYALPGISISPTEIVEDEFVMLQTHGKDLNISRVLEEYAERPDANTSAIENLVIDFGIMPHGTCVSPGIYSSLAASYLEAATENNLQEFAKTSLIYGTTDKTKWTYEDVVQSIVWSRSAEELSNIKRVLLLNKVRELRVAAVESGASHVIKNGEDPLFAEVEKFCDMLDSPRFGGMFDDDAKISSWIPDETTALNLSSIVISDPYAISTYGGPILAAYGVLGYNNFITNSVFAVFSKEHFSETRKLNARPIDWNSGDIFYREYVPSVVGDTIAHYRPSTPQKPSRVSVVRNRISKCEPSRSTQVTKREPSVELPAEHTSKVAIQLDTRKQAK